MPTLDWIGKNAVIDYHRKVPYQLLRCDQKLSAGDADSGNLLVQGDNLLALKALLPYYAGKVKCIYIDPPYNTGNECWIYNDNVNSPEIRQWLRQAVGKEGEDLSRHDKWLCMMYPRLALLREFLAEDGVLFVSIDDVESATLRILLDEIFGKQLFIGCFIWKSRQQRDNRNITGASIDHEYVYCYGSKIRGADRQRSMYKNPDNDPRGDWTSSNMVGLATKEARPNLHFDLINPETGINYGCPAKGWRYERDTMVRLGKEDKIIWPKSSAGRPRRKFFYTELVAEFTGFSSLIGEGIFTRNGTQDIVSTLGSAVFSFPKPVALIQELINQATDKDSLVMDSFAGSGTTAHAVLAQNAADGGSRKFILVEMDEKICQTVTAQRIGKAVGGYGEGKNAVRGLGSGFRYCKLEGNLFSATGGIAPEVSFSDLAAHVFFTETGTPLPKRKNGKTPLLGEFQGRAIYLLYNGILGDKRPDGGNVLTHAVAQDLPPHPDGSGPRIVYGEACRLGQKSLQDYDIVFRQIPFELKVD